MENPNEPHICLLQGPPGTGKTRTTASLILQLLLLNPSYNILVCSPSNAGVDEIVQRTRKEMKDLKKSFKIVRYGVSNNVSCATQPLLLDNQVQKALTKDHLVSRQRREEISLAKIHIDRLKTAKRCTKRAEADLLILRKTHQDELDRIMENRSSDVNRLRRLFIKSAHIVATTLSSCSNDALDSLIEKTGKRFDFCVVDEACTCTEMEIMQPISYGMKNLILVGDHKQLQATVFSKVAASVGYHKSLFWRLAKVYGDDNILSLRTQYRMHPAISEFPSRRFYNNCLLNAPSTVRYAGVCPYILLDVIDSEEETKGVNIQNSAEALLASQLAILLAETNELPTIGVIAPYRMHKEGIIELLKKSDLATVEKIEVDTVDAFQGREKHAMVLTTVRARGKGIGFLSHPERLNVALTRAKRSLIICGHLKTLRQNEWWNRLISDAEKRQVLHHVKSNISVPKLKEILFLRK